MQRLAFDATSWALSRRLIADHVRPHARTIAAALILMGVVAAATAALAKMMEPILDQPGFREALQAHERAERINTGRVAAALVVFLMPAGVVLDYFVSDVLLAILPKPPWFVTNRQAHEVTRKITYFEADPGLLKLPGIFYSALRG